MTEPVLLEVPARRVIVPIHKGLPWSMFYTLKDSGVIRDITGYVARTRILEAPAGALLLNWDEYQTLGGAAGTVSVKVPDEITSALAWSSKKWFFHEVETPAGEPVYRLYGDTHLVKTGA